MCYPKNINATKKALSIEKNKEGQECHGGSGQN